MPVYFSVYKGENSDFYRDENFLSSGDVKLPLGIITERRAVFDKEKIRLKPSAVKLICVEKYFREIDGSFDEREIKESETEIKQDETFCLIKTDFRWIENIDEIEKYLNEKSIKIFCCKDENKTNGMIVVSFIEDNKIEVFGIAVDTLHQHKGIGSFMINNLIEKFNLKYILAETDNDAVGFYRKNNFAITQFEKIYNNTKVIRYKCELIK